MNTSAPQKLSVLYLEAYAGASHVRVAGLLERHSSHELTCIYAERDHWKSLAMMSHVELAQRVQHLPASYRPDLIIVSGATNLPALRRLLPERMQTVPLVSYFHESQWSYPSNGEDTRPFLVQHLDAIVHSDESWFNSAFHLNEFQSGSNAPCIQRQIRDIAARVLQENASHLRVVYPPVAMESLAAPMDLPEFPPAILWNARWEHDKRPDLFIDALRQFSERITVPRIVIAGTAGADPDDIASALRPVSENVVVHGFLPARRDYELALGNGGIIVSTADHEFFGIGILEGVLAGNVPLLPYALAYPETIPSAWFYKHQDAGDLARTLEAMLTSHPGASLPMHRSDASRFELARTVQTWDAEMLRVVAAWSDRDSIGIPPRVAPN